MRLWRIVRARHVASAFSGEGALRYSARWNPAGTAIAYASEHLSLAALELFVHAVEDEEPDDLVRIEAEFPIDASEVKRQRDALLRKLPSAWRMDARLTQGIGERFVRDAQSAVLFVPSVVIEEEWNIVVNPRHADFAKLRIVSTKPFRFDPRMFR